MSVGFVLGRGVAWKVGSGSIVAGPMDETTVAADHNQG